RGRGAEATGGQPRCRAHPSHRARALASNPDICRAPAPSPPRRPPRGRTAGGGGRERRSCVVVAFIPPAGYPPPPVLDFLNAPAPLRPTKTGGRTRPRLAPHG